MQIHSFSCIPALSFSPPFLPAFRACNEQTPGRKLLSVRKYEGEEQRQRRIFKFFSTDMGCLVRGKRAKTSSDHEEGSLEKGETSVGTVARESTSRLSHPMQPLSRIVTTSSFLLMHQKQTCILYINMHLKGH